MSVITTTTSNLSGAKSRTLLSSGVLDWSKATAWLSNGVSSFSAPAPGILIQHFGGTAVLDGVTITNISYGATLHLAYTTSCVTTGTCHGVQITSPNKQTVGGYAINNVTQTRVQVSSGNGNPGINLTYSYTLPTPVCIVESVGWSGFFQNNGQGGQNMRSNCYVYLNGADTGNVDKLINQVGTGGYENGVDGGRSHSGFIPIMLPCRGTLKVRLEGDGGTGNTPSSGNFTLVYYNAL